MLHSILQHSQKQSNFDDSSHKIFHLPRDEEEFQQLLSNNPSIQIYDKIQIQIKDLVKLENPHLYPISDEQYQIKIKDKIGDKVLESFGCWVYYPWRNSVVHLLDESDFIQVRTIRNAYKISHEEQAKLQQKTVLIVGLSVGQSAAMVMAMERTCGHLILADFDDLELSNLNRLRASVMDLSILKGIVISRAIAEIDPFIKVTFLKEGITNQNIEQVLKGVYLVMEECDSFDTKVLIRKACKKLQIPVVMETSDRGLLDVERFDLDKDYPILHGLIKKEFLEIDKFTPEHKKQLFPQFIDLSKASERGVYSVGQVGKTLTSWPQLASEVTFGSAIGTMTTRMILLGENVPSQRIFLDAKKSISTGKSFSDATVDEDVKEKKKMVLESNGQLAIYTLLVVGISYACFKICQ